MQQADPASGFAGVCLSRKKVSAEQSELNPGCSDLGQGHHSMCSSLMRIPRVPFTVTFCKICAQSTLQKCSEFMPQNLTVSTFSNLVV